MDRLAELAVVALAPWRELDTESSASRQHYVDTGDYLFVGEAQEA